MNIDRNIVCQQICLRVEYKRGFFKIPKTVYSIWIKDNMLCLFPAWTHLNDDDYIFSQIPLDKIEYYSTKGKVTKQTKISGGGGTVGGSSIGGAIVGGIVAGGAGAIVGSRKAGKVEPIKSEIITHDDRECYINFFVEDVKHSLFFKFSDYNTLLKLIPDKAYANLTNQQSPQLQK